MTAQGSSQPLPKLCRGAACEDLRCWSSQPAVRQPFPRASTRAWTLKKHRFSSFATYKTSDVSASVQITHNDNSHSCLSRWPRVQWPDLAAEVMRRVGATAAVRAADGRGISKALSSILRHKAVGYALFTEAISACPQTCLQTSWSGSPRMGSKQVAVANLEF